MTQKIRPNTTTRKSRLSLIKYNPNNRLGADTRYINKNATEGSYILDEAIVEDKNNHDEEMPPQIVGMTNTKRKRTIELLPSELYEKDIDIDDNDTTDGTKCNTKSSNHRHDSTMSYDDCSCVNTVIGKQETKDVSKLRLLVVLVLLAAATTVSVTTFITLRKVENKSFQQTFLSDSEKVLQSLSSSTKNAISSLDLMATTIVSHVQSTTSAATAAAAGVTTNDTVNIMTQRKGWPYVTIPNYSIRAAKLLSTNCIGCIGLWFSIIIQPSQRHEWEQYAWLNKNTIINDQIQMMYKDSNYYNIANNTNISSIVPVQFSLSIQSELGPIPYDDKRQFNVDWQQYPLPSKGFPPYNWDWYSDTETIESVQKYANTDRTAVISKPYINPNPNDPASIEEAQYWADAFRNLVDPTESSYEPASDIIYPIINDITEIDTSKINVTNSTSSYNTTKGAVVGNVATTIYWRDLLKNILPDTETGIVVVFNFTCSEPFAYRIDGSKAILIGHGDLHDSKYTHMGVQERLIDGNDRNNNNGGIKSRYSGVPINTNYCPIYINVYPSNEMEYRFLTWRPIIYSVVSILIFIVTSNTFIIYDRKVERRQQIVLTSAEQNNAVVSSLFPSSVRDKIIRGANKMNNNNNNIGTCTEIVYSSKNEGTETTSETIDIESSSGSRGNHILASSRNNHDWWNTRTNHSSRRDSSGSSSHNSTTATATATSESISPYAVPFRSTTLASVISPPIAELYEETTILFADIVGFTYWSSFHTPTDVFTLLETLYHEFDQCARSRHVFKVETIGDCYVAAVGLPKVYQNSTNTKNSNHAVIMSRFAYDILQKTETVMLQLSIVLGEETCYLSIRIGINSGPTTAGVLRGDKSRF